MPQAPSASPTLSRIAALALGVFLAAAIALHVLRPDLDPVHSQMSLFLIGDWGPLLQAAYVALGVGMVCLAFGIDRSLASAARSAAPVLLFVLGALSLSITAYAWMDLPGIDDSIEGLIHGVSAQGAFLFATTGMVLLGLRLRRDPAWRRSARWLLPWAVACFAAIWLLALWQDAPRGLAQKTVIALIVGWLVAVTVLLRRHGPRARAGSALESHGRHRP